MSADPKSTGTQRDRQTEISRLNEQAAHLTDSLDAGVAAATVKAAINERSGQIGWRRQGELNPSLGLERAVC